MIGGLLVACGAVLGVAGTWNGYHNARDSLAPLTEAGDPTRAAIDPRQVQEGARLDVECLELVLREIADAQALALDALSPHGRKRSGDELHQR